MTNERGLNETPEQRAARIQAAKERAAAAKAARDGGGAPPAAAAAPPQDEPVATAEVFAAEAEDDRPRTASGTLKRDPDAPKMAPAATPEERRARIEAAKAAAAAAKQKAAAAPAARPAARPAAAAAATEAAVDAGPVDDRPRTASGTLKRDPNAPKMAPAATPEERRARIEAAKAAAAAAKAVGGSRPAARAGSPAAGGEFAADTVEDEAPSDGLARTAKGTIKRDPNAPKMAPPATPEERRARIEAAKAAAAAAKQKAAAAPAAAPKPQLGAVARAAKAVPSGPDAAAYTKAWEAISKPVPGAAPVLRPVAAAKAERAAGRAEFEMSREAKATVDAFRKALGAIPFDVLSTPNDPMLVIHPEDVYKVMEIARSDKRLEMDYLRMVTAVDHIDEGIEIVYYLKSLSKKHAAGIKTMLPVGQYSVASVTSIWPGANWHEREMMEMFGVVCTGHPDPRNLLLDEDMKIHPLLKAHPLAEVELKQGVNVF